MLGKQLVGLYVSLERALVMIVLDGSTWLSDVLMPLD